MKHSLMHNNFSKADMKEVIKLVKKKKFDTNSIL